VNYRLGFQFSIWTNAYVEFTEVPPRTSIQGNYVALTWGTSATFYLLSPGF